ncbi:MAG TPA: MFS transporter, partial [Steroidobacteraceae bacterium]|nr:MFS transporter [Steroidobacteraceae bacterium]
GSAAEYAGFVGVSVIAGRLVTGFLIDKLWAPGIAFAFLSAPAVSCLLLSVGLQSDVWLAIAALIVGLAAGAELDLIAFLVSRYFGLRHYGAIYGAVFVFFAVGSGFAPAVFGSVYDRFHTYTPILVVAASLFVVGGSLLLLLGKYPELREQKPNSVEVRD